MPTYQYACTVCGHRFEAVQSFSDAALTECPECTGRLRKVFSAVGVVFKGSGFYRTDSGAAAKNGSSDRDSADSKPVKSPDKAPAGAGSSSSSSDGSNPSGSSKSAVGNSGSGNSGSGNPGSGNPGSGNSGSGKSRSGNVRGTKSGGAGSGATSSGSAA